LNVPITVVLPVDASIVPVGEQPWLHQWTEAGKWSVVRGAQYVPAASEIRVTVRPTGLYALSTMNLREVWMPAVSIMR
jgi:hypothetical protein